MSTRLRVPVTERDHLMGPADAPVTLVEYGDYECPHCRRAHPIVASVLQQMGEQVRFAYRHVSGENDLCWQTLGLAGRETLAGPQGVRHEGICSAPRGFASGIATINRRYKCGITKIAQ